MISRVIRISLFYQNSTCFVSAYFLKHHPIFNEYGKYGGKYSSNSIWNTYSKYGNEYNSYSPFNEYSLNPPIVIKNNRVVAKLTVNDSISNALNPYVLKACNF